MSTILPETLSYDGRVGMFAVVLLVCTVVLVVGAEWPRLSARFGSDARASRGRRRRKESFTLIEGADARGDDADFAASVQRDLERLPVIEKHDDSSHRR
jgi:hypothetical protein